jgi:hypothetical protein
MSILFEVWQSPGGRRWQGEDQEEAILTAMRARRPGTITELAQVRTPEGKLHLRRIARYDDRVKSSADQA